MVVRSFNRLDAESKREIDTAVYDAICARESLRRTPYSAPVAAVYQPNQRARRKATTRYAACCAAMAALVALLAWGTATAQGIALATAIFGLWVLILPVGGAWLASEYERWRADK